MCSRLPLILTVFTVAALLGAPAHAATKFFDRDLLFDTLIRDELRDREFADEALEEAQQELADAIGSGAPQEEIDELRANVEAMEDEIVAIDDEIEATGDKVGELSEPQVFDLNRSLQNTRSNGLIPDIDSEELDRVIAENFCKQEINALTKAFEEEAKGERKAEQFEEKYEASGLPQFLRHRDRAIAHGERQKEKFLEKIERFQEPEPVSTDDAAVSVARHEAQGVASQAARNESKKAARNSVAKEIRKEQRGAARGLAKGKQK